MHGIVEGRANEIVHGRIHNDESLAAIRFGVQHAHQQHACRGDDGTAGLEQQVAAERAENAGDRLGVIGRGEGLLVRVAHAEAAAEIEIAKRDAGTRELAEIASQASRGRGGKARASESASRCER